jgi:hypothetical protein
MAKLTALDCVVFCSYKMKEPLKQLLSESIVFCGVLGIAKG